MAFDLYPQLSYPLFREHVPFSGADRSVSNFLDFQRFALFFSLGPIRSVRHYFSFFLETNALP